MILGSPLEPYCKRWIVVTAPQEQAIARIMRRDAISKEQAQERLSVQTPEEALLRRADYHISNSGAQEALERQADNVLKALLSDV